MGTLVTVIHVFVCLFLMLTVLLQEGKGGMGSALGGGSTQGSVFGGAGAGGILRKVTVIAASLFMVTSMVLAFLSSQNADNALIKYAAEQQRVKSLREAQKKEVLEGKTPDATDSTDTTTAGDGGPATAPMGDAGAAAGDAGATTIETPATAPVETAPPADKPTTKPADKPAKPTTKPADKPAKPTTKPADEPAKATTKPADKPAEPTTPPADKPAEPAPPTP